MEKTELKRWTERYQNHLMVLNYSHGTIKNHMLLLNRFLAYLSKGGIQDIQSVTKETIRDYQTHLYQEINFRGEPNTVSTQNKALSVVKTFFHLLCEEGYLAGNPSKDITYAREPKKVSENE